jgi:methionine-S-sulfoxide reductase
MVNKNIIIKFLILITFASSFFVNGEDQKGEGKMEREVLEKATFAGGCFWCIESAFDETEGVKEAVSGYTGGKTKNPTYPEVCSGKTGHYEAVQVTFDSNKITYKELVEIFWQQIDPTDPTGQFADKGSQYKTAIFYHNDEQKKIAEESKKKLEESGKFDKPIVTEIKEAKEFYPAEEYHQDYYKMCPIKYQNYKVGSGREPFLKKTWKKVINKD